MTEWVSIDDHKELKIVADGKLVVIRPKDKRNVVPLFCPVCEFPMKDSADFLSFREFECCQHCELKFARTHSGWVEGLRPSKQSVGWLEYIQNRELLFRPVIKFS